jgi:hypothetical protein
MHFGESLHIFIKYVTTYKTNTITFENNILSFHKEELVTIWNTVLNNNLQWPSIARSFVNYDIKSVTPKDVENNIKQYKFPYNFKIDTILIRPPRSKKIKHIKETKIIKKSILRNVQEKKTVCIKKRVHFDDSVFEDSSILDKNLNIEDKQILNNYEQIKQELLNTYNYNHNDYNYNSIHQNVQLIKQSSFSKIPF